MNQEAHIMAWTSATVFVTHYLWVDPGASGERQALDKSVEKSLWENKNIVLQYGKL